jgi:hypothetical protein
MISKQERKIRNDLYDMGYIQAISDCIKEIEELRTKLMSFNYPGRIETQIIYELEEVKAKLQAMQETKQ